MDKKRSKFESETFKQLIGGSTASSACSMQGYKFERKTFKLLIGGSTACEKPAMIKTDRACIILEKVIDCFFEKIKASRKNALLALAISLCAFVIACIGCIEVGETEYKSGDAGFGKLPLSAAATLSLINGDAKTYDCELTARDEYLRSTGDDEQFVTVPALSKRPAPIYHSDITDDPGDWHNAHVAMYYRKECIWTE